MFTELRGCSLEVTFSKHACGPPERRGVILCGHIKARDSAWQVGPARLNGGCQPPRTSSGPAVSPAQLLPRPPAQGLDL